jgi:hypothetical protein
LVRRESGPRRSQSLEAYLRRTRVLAAVALLALVAGVISDALAASFWNRHALLAGLVASLIVVMLTVALVNEAVERRSRERWSVLAQYVMLELVRDARLVWTGLAQLAGLMPADPYGTDGDLLGATAAIDSGSSAVRDTARLTAALRELLADAGMRRSLHDKVALFVEHNDSVLGRWSAVMLNADAYAEVIDRHVQLAGDLIWLGSLLAFQLAEDDGRARRGRSHPAAMIEGPLDDEQLAQRLVAITQLAEQLDRGTLAVALRIVPVEWWREQLGTTGALPADASEQRGERV